MVHAQLSDRPTNIWRLPGRRAPRADRLPKPLIVSSLMDDSPQYSPDGTRLLFGSNRSGRSNIWLADAEGQHPVQLTTFDNFAGTPRWSPDGKTIVFDGRESGTSDIYSLAVDGGRPRRLTDSPAEDVTPSYSRDGRSVYFASDRSGGQQVWRMAADGSDPVQVTGHGGAFPIESFDGKSVYYTKPGDGGVWRRPVGGGDEVEVVPRNVWWALSRSGLYYYWNRETVFARRSLHQIRFVDFGTGRETTLYEEEGPQGVKQIDVSPDEAWLVYGAYELASSELILIEGFR